MSFSRVGADSPSVIGFPNKESAAIKGYDPCEAHMEQEPRFRDTIDNIKQDSLIECFPLYRSGTSRNSITKTLKKMVRSLSFSKPPLKTITTHFSNSLFQGVKPENSVIVTVMKLGKNHSVARCQHLGSGSGDIQTFLSNDLKEFNKENLDEASVSLESLIIEKVLSSNGTSISFKFHYLSNKGKSQVEQKCSEENFNSTLMPDNLMKWIDSTFDIDAIVIKKNAREEVIKQLDAKVDVKEEVITQSLPSSKEKTPSAVPFDAKVDVEKQMLRQPLPPRPRKPAIEGRPQIPSDWRSPAQNVTKKPMKGGQSFHSGVTVRSGSIDTEGFQYSPKPTSPSATVKKPTQQVYSNLSDDRRIAPVLNSPKNSSTDKEILPRRNLPNSGGKITIKNSLPNGKSPMQAKEFKHSGTKGRPQEPKYAPIPQFSKGTRTNFEKYLEPKRRGLGDFSGTKSQQ